MFFDDPNKRAGRPLVIGHRGASGHATENTLEAFSLARDLGADGVELDVQLTSDGIPVVFHDFDLSRLLGVGGRLSAMPFGALKRLHLGNGETIPTLEEALDATRGLGVNIELKGEGWPAGRLERAVLGCVNGMEAADRVIVSSFNPLMLANTRAYAALRRWPVKTAFLFDPKSAHSWLRNASAGYVLRTCAINPCKDAVDAGSVARWHRDGFKVMVWTVNEASEMRSMIERGVDAIITDFRRIGRSRRIGQIMKLGNLEIPVPLFLAPMAGITDPPYRTICRESGMAVGWSEMVSSAGLSQGGRRTMAYIDMAMDTGPTVLQLFGAHPGRMRIAAGVCRNIPGVVALDINMGCPVKKVSRSGAGVSLMSHPDLAAELVAAVRHETDLPVTVKIRAGQSASSIVAPEFARMMEDAGADAISVHPRTAAQGYSGRADWPVIAKVKAAVKVPVIGNGDVRSVEDAERLISETGCDGVMIGRGALGNPWLFASVRRWMETGVREPMRPSIEELIATAMRHLRYMEAFCSTREKAIVLMRKHLVYYTRGIYGSVQLRPSLMAAKTGDEVMELLQKLKPITTGNQPL
ncbi:MAG: tRNA dihydrouridine synthase DusB [Myxococcota bacterium]